MDIKKNPDTGSQTGTEGRTGNSELKARKKYIQPTLLNISHVDSEGGKGAVSPTEAFFAGVSPS